MLGWKPLPWNSFFPIVSELSVWDTWEEHTVSLVSSSCFIIGCKILTKNKVLTGFFPQGQDLSLSWSLGSWLVYTAGEILKFCSGRALNMLVSCVLQLSLHQGYVSAFHLLFSSLLSSKSKWESLVFRDPRWITTFGKHLDIMFILFLSGSLPKSMPSYGKVVHEQIVDLIYLKIDFIFYTK